MKRLLSLCFIIMLGAGAKAQQYTNANATGANGNAYPFYFVSKIQCLYPAAKFSTAPSGNISTIYFRGSGTGTVTLSDLTIKLGTTTSSQYTSSTDAFITGLTTVYSATSASLSVVSDQWYAITLATPFPFTAGSNLVLEISETGNSGTQFLAYNTIETTTCKLISASVTATNGTTIGTGINHVRLLEFGFDIASAAGTPTISANNSPVCAGSTVSLTATSTATNPTYNWTGPNSFTATGATITIPNAAAANAGTYNVTVTSGGTTSASAAAIVVVNPTIPIQVSIASNPGTTICSGTSTVFTATPINGGTTPVYQWKKNGNNVGTNSANYTDNGLATNDIISCDMTSNATCPSPATTTSNALQMFVNASVVPAISVSNNSGTSVCEGIPVLFTAAPVNPGSAPVYQWKKNGNNVGSNTTTYTDNALTNNDAITCVLTNNDACASPANVTATTLTMTVNPLPAKPTITASGNTLTSSVANGNQWLLNSAAISGATNQTYTITTDGWYQVSVTDANGCSNKSDSTQFTTGVTSIARNGNLKVYPSPFKEKLFVELASNDNHQMIIADCLGHTVFQTTIHAKKTELDLSNLASGVYFLSTASGDSRATIRVVKL
ncbi:T9SS type A sorting domain-containing protein [Taibaiella soli]|uniref:Ig-like domain-containing protein n=1 Tax=Taibaiella soli TaxID=1649169 RepID=A0A2W2BJM6_9BACT|nr:T9SS type A sorting domain-containing protein [Taibaiella soli]PZF73646.1 hypothetical protein DN068_06505 [Taibaiella soli]